MNVRILVQFAILASFSVVSAQTTAPSFEAQRAQRRAEVERTMRALDLKAREFDWPVSPNDTLLVKSAQNWRAWNSGSSGSLYVFRSSSSSSILDLYYKAPASHSEPTYVMTVGSSEHIRIQSHQNQPCYTLLGPPQHEGPPRPTFRFRGVYVDLSSYGNTGLDWAPNGFVGRKFKRVESVWVLDPPPDAPQLQSFYVVCGYKAAQAMPVLIAVIAIPASVGQGFPGFTWNTAKAN